MDALYAAAPGTWCFCRRPEPPLNPRECGNCGRCSVPNIRNQSHQCESYGSLELRVVYSLVWKEFLYELLERDCLPLDVVLLRREVARFAVSCGCEKTLAGLSQHQAIVLDQF